MGSFNLNNPGAGIDRRVEKNFPFQSRRPLMERRENFFIENTRERERESLLFSRRRGKKKRRVNWRMQFWRNSLGVNCSILHNSNNSTNELHYYGYGIPRDCTLRGGGEFLRYLRFRNANPPRSIIANVINRFDRRRYAFEKLSKRLLREFASNLFSRDENKDRCNRTI